MKKKIYLILFLYYKYYKKGDFKYGAFDSAIGVFIIFIFFNLLTFTKIIGIPITKLIPFSSGDSEVIRYFMTFLYVILPSHLLMHLLFKKDKMEEYNFTQDETDIGYIVLFFYIIFSIAAFILSYAFL